MTVYLDADFKCHVEDDGTMTAYETDVFGGKCRTYIEGHRIIPEGMTWIRPDGIAFHGFMISPWVDSKTLITTQQGYEDGLAEAQLAYERGVNSI